jgi:hypothetical protein
MHKINTYLLVSLLIILPVLLGGCRKEDKIGCGDNAASVKQTCDNSLPVPNDLRLEAMALAVNYDIEAGINPTDAFIPESAWMPFVRVLRAVRAAIPQMNCESLNPMADVQARAIPSNQDFLVIVDTSFQWTRSWFNGNSLTGNPQIDSLMNTYQLSLSEYREEGIDGWATLTSQEPLNIRLLLTYFAPIDGVLDAVTDVVITDIPNISGSSEGSDIVLNISRGYISCPEGCIPSASFRIGPDCTVDYEQ